MQYNFYESNNIFCGLQNLAVNFGTCDIDLANKYLKYSHTYNMCEWILQARECENVLSNMQTVAKPFHAWFLQIVFHKIGLKLAHKLKFFANLLAWVRLLEVDGTQIQQKIL